MCGTDSGNGLGSVGRGWNASLTASLVNAMAAALINAGSIPMRGVVCAVAVGRVKGEADGELILDPEEVELPQLAGSGCFAFLFSSSLSGSGDTSADVPPCSLLWTNYTTAVPFDVSELGRVKELAQKGARQVWLSLKQSLGSRTTSITVKSVSNSEPFSQDMEVDDEKVEI